MARNRIGIWFIGAKGGVASTAIVGLLALKKGLTQTTALVSELPQFKHLELVDWKDLVLGGHEIRDLSSYEEAMRLSTESRAIDGELIAKIKGELDKLDKVIRPGTAANSGATIEGLAMPAVKSKTGESPRDTIDRLQADMKKFADENKLAHVIVINVASTEPPFDAAQFPAKWNELAKLFDKPKKCPLPASSLYAIAALELGYSHFNFTPLARFEFPGDRRAGRRAQARATWATTARRAKRCSRACSRRCLLAAT
ncbi:MAG: inositol-3-phosphate synthase [Pirellulales bacterium]